MDALKTLQARPDLFFRLSGIRLADFAALVAALEPLFRKQEHKRLSRAGRQRAIGGGRTYHLPFKGAGLDLSDLLPDLHQPCFSRAGVRGFLAHGLSLQSADNMLNDGPFSLAGAPRQAVAERAG
jgi:hypothetical protein